MDAVIKEGLWEACDKTYYPKGVTDQDYCVLKFTAQNGRYYSNFKSDDFEDGKKTVPLYAAFCL